MSGHIEAVVNREVVDPKLQKKDGVLWWRVVTCPLEGCNHFKKAKAWSMFGPDDVRSYLKHHLIYCSAEPHCHVTEEDADILCHNAEIIKEEWTLAERKEYARHNEIPEQPPAKKRRHDQLNDPPTSTASGSTAAPVIPMHDVGALVAVAARTPRNPQLLVDALERAEVAMRTALHQSLVHARHMQNEIVIVQEALRALGRA